MAIVSDDDKLLQALLEEFHETVGVDTLRKLYETSIEDVKLRKDVDLTNKDIASTYNKMVNEARTTADFDAAVAYYAEHKEQLEPLVIDAALINEILHTSKALKDFCLNGLVKYVKETGVNYRGTWDPDTVYGINDYVMHGDVLWCANKEDVDCAPGTENKWTLLFDFSNIVDALQEAVTQELKNKADVNHQHDASDITGGTVPVNRGGTGADNADNARNNLGAAAAKHTHDASDIVSGTLGVNRGGTGASTLTNYGVLVGKGTSAITSVGGSSSGAVYKTSANTNPTIGTLPIAQGGTGATTASTALSNLGAASSNHKHWTLYTAGAGSNWYVSLAENNGTSLVPKDYISVSGDSLCMFWVYETHVGSSSLHNSSLIDIGCATVGDSFDRVTSTSDGTSINVEYKNNRLKIAGSPTSQDTVSWHAMAVLFS